MTLRSLSLNVTSLYLPVRPIIQPIAISPAASRATVLEPMRGPGVGDSDGDCSGASSGGAGFLRSSMATMIAPTTPAASSTHSHKRLFFSVFTATGASTLEGSFSLTVLL